MNIIPVLEKFLSESLHPEQWDDDIQPSLRKKYDGDKLGEKIKTLIQILTILEKEVNE